MKRTLAVLTLSLLLIQSIPALAATKTETVSVMVRYRLVSSPPDAPTAITAVQVKVKGNAEQASGSIRETWRTSQGTVVWQWEPTSVHRAESGAAIVYGMLTSVDDPSDLVPDYAYTPGETMLSMFYLDNGEGAASPPDRLGGFHHYEPLWYMHQVATYLGLDLESGVIQVR